MLLETDDELLKEIENIRYKNLLVIVEGKKDKIAMNKFGIKNVKTINRALFEVVEEINNKEVVLLTDLDREGKKLFHVLNSVLQRRRIKVNNKLRNILFRSSLSNIEGLDSYLRFGQL